MTCCLKAPIPEGESVFSSDGPPDTLSNPHVVSPKYIYIEKHQKASARYGLSLYKYRPKQVLQLTVKYYVSFPWLRLAGTLRLVSLH